MSYWGSHTSVVVPFSSGLGVHAVPPGQSEVLRHSVKQLADTAPAPPELRQMAPRSQSSDWESGPALMLHPAPACFGLGSRDAQVGAPLLSMLHFCVHHVHLAPGWVWQTGSHGSKDWEVHPATGFGVQISCTSGDAVSGPCAPPPPLPPVGDEESKLARTHPRERASTAAR